MRQYINELSVWQRFQLIFVALRTGKKQEEVMEEIIEKFLNEQKRVSKQNLES